MSERPAEQIPVRFLRGGIRDEREILKTLQDLAHDVDTGKKVRLILNLEKIEYLCSAGLGSLVALLKKVRVSNGELKLCCLNESVRELFELMLLTRIFEIFETEELARKSF